MSGAWLLRPTGADDLEAVREIESAPHAEPWVGQWSIERHRAAIDDPATLHLVATDATDTTDTGNDGPIHGYGIITDLDDVDNNIQLMRLALRNAGTGKGEWFVRALVDRAFAVDGAHRVWLDVVAKNERAEALYRRIGFVREGTMRQAYCDSTGRSDLYLMSMLRPEWTP